MNDLSEVNFIQEYKPKKDAFVELYNGRFVDVANADFYNENAKVILKGGRIAAIPGVEEQPPDIKPDFFIDLKGKTVMPGLVNTHCHTTHVMPSLLPDFKDVKIIKPNEQKQIKKNMVECLAHGITNIRDAWAADLRKAKSIRERIQSEEIMGPRVMQAVAVGPPGGYLTEKHGTIIKYLRSKMGVPTIDYGLEYSGTVEFDINATEQQVKDAVNRAIDERGADAIKIGEQKENMTNFKPDAIIMRLDQLEAIADQARKRNFKSTIHHTSVDTFRRALLAGVSSLAHIPGDELLQENDIASFLSQGCIIEPTMTVPYDTCYKIKGDPLFDDPYLTLLTEFREKVHDGIVDEFWIPEFKAAVRRHHGKLAKEKMVMLGLFPMKKMFKNFASYCTTGARNLKILFERGAIITTSNDGGVPPCTLPMLQHEIDLFDLFLNKASGKTIFGGADAVRMATINGAKCLGLEEDFGSIEVGKVADLVVVDGNPFEDHRVVGSRVAALFKDGKLIINDCKLQLMTSSNEGQCHHS